ncbi:MAG TPA: DUF2155 domain-containing protein [Stellaceae bacterium]
MKWFASVMAAGILALALPARAEVTAVLQGLDKTTARVATIDAPINRQIRYGNLLITARACVKHPPTETPESAAFLEIEELPPDAGPRTRAEQIFSGWMFSSSPALSALENPVYDVSVLDCKGDNPAADNVAPAPPDPPALRKPDNGTLTDPGSKIIRRDG